MPVPGQRDRWTQTNGQDAFLHLWPLFNCDFDDTATDIRASLRVLSLHRPFVQEATGESAQLAPAKTKVGYNHYKNHYSGEKEGQPFRAGLLISPLE